MMMLAIGFLTGFVLGFCALDIYYEHRSRKTLEELNRSEVPRAR